MAIPGTNIEPLSAVMASAAGGGGHVLIIEDDESMRLLETLSLQSRGWAVSAASTGREGVATATEASPEVIICDLLLPDISGMEVIAALAQNAATASIPVVLVTGMGDLGDIVAGIEAGAQDYLVKPFRMIELEVRCRAALRVSRQHRLLARSEARYRALLDHLPDTVAVVLDTELRVVIGAGADLAARDLDGGDMVGRRFDELIGADDSDYLEGIFRSAFGGQATSTEFRSQRTGIDNLLDVVPVLVRGAEMDEILVVARDIGPLKARERAFASAEQRWRTAFEQAPVGMAHIGVDGRFRRVNPALCTMLGYTADQILSMQPVDISHPDDTDEAAHAIADLAADTIGHFRTEKRYLDAKGLTVWCAVSAVPVHDPQGQVDHILVHFLDISAQKRLETELHHLAVHDPLTGLLNRRGFDRALASHVAYVDRYGPRGALLVLDLDGLKVINDTCGHNAGDEAITATANVLQRRLRSTDTIARLGGDEYAVILPDANRDQAAVVAAMLVTAIRTETTPLDADVELTASIGVALFDTPGRTPQDLMSHADRSMYAAKNAGRNGFAIQPQSGVTVVPANGRRASLTRSKADGGRPRAPLLLGLSPAPGDVGGVTSRLPGGRSPAES